MSAARAHSVSIPIGAIKQFGPFGPEYEVLGPAQPEEGQAMVRIVLVRTNEEVTYPLQAMLDDPEAR